MVDLAAQVSLYPLRQETLLILKLNGKTNVPSDAEAFSAAAATVEDAVRLGADAVGYTLYDDKYRRGGLQQDIFPTRT
jgi:DhnA family fructose-bisphosphate aldolase class Ia